MRVQEAAVGASDSKLENPLSNVRVSSLDPVYLERVRWRCRRGLLELDIVLGRFIEKHYPQLNESQRLEFDELLDLPDNDLWELITGKLEPTRAQQHMVLEWLKVA